MTEAVVTITATLTLTVTPLLTETLSQAIDDEVFHARAQLERNLSTTGLTLVDFGVAEVEREPSDDEIYNRPGVEGGIGYPIAGNL